MSEHNLSITNQLSQLDVVAEAIEALSEEWGIPMALALNLNLVLEELITNIIFYGYSDQEEHTISIGLSFDGNRIQMQLEDDAKEFDPTLRADPKIDESIEERNIGGLGIYFVRKIMDGMTYRRSGNKNILTLTKKIEKTN